MSKKIKILKNGPYEVSGDIPLKQSVIEIDENGISQRWKDGKKYETNDKTYNLCRCGHSKNKPFCDGTHIKIDFDGEETASKEPYLDGCQCYKGETIDILDNEQFCSSMRFCDRGVRAWNAAIRSKNPENRKLAIEEAADCAGGRLTIIEKDGTILEPKLPQEIGVVHDTAAGRQGPLWVKGGIEVEGADGESYEVRNRVTLCRCGESSNMPFCDTSHMTCSHTVGKD